jgi:hypothetical protein
LESSLNFYSFEIPHILELNVFNRSLSSFFSHQMLFIIWILLIVLCKINSCLIHCYSFFEFLNQNLNLKFHQMDFWFEFLDVHMNEKNITYNDCHGFKWKNINIYSILIIFLCDLMSFLALWIMTTPTWSFEKKIWFGGHHMM